MGMITLSAQKPQVDVALTATLTDDDAIPAIKSMMLNGNGNILRPRMDRGPRYLLPRIAVYTPLGVEDKYLRVTATYDRRAWF